MRKANKSLLMHALLGKDSLVTEWQDIIKTENNVIDGGALLRNIKWKEGEKFKEIICRYQSFITSKYGLCSIVFDGYENIPSTKDHEHMRRAKVTCPKIWVENETTLSVSQSSFLSNNENKHEFLTLLKPVLENDGHEIIQAKSDADSLIVSTVLQKARDVGSVSLHGTDTDLAIMLLHHWRDNYADIVMKSDLVMKGRKQLKQLKVKEHASCIDDDTRNLLLFIHAFGGCDTVSGIHEKSNNSVYKLLKNNSVAKNLASKFMSQNASREEIGEAGMKMFILLYGGKDEDDLCKLRYNQYMKMTAGTNRINPSKLPPSERAAYFHSLRVYLQVVFYINLL